MQTKKCFKCGREFPIAEFYNHPQMLDGHLNKCKDCTKKDAKIRYEQKSADEMWMEKERVRGRDKYKRLGYKDKYQKITREICPQEAGISKKLRMLGYDTSGKEAHHWNYNRPFSVFLISRKAHHRIHLHMTVNRDDKYCYKENGERIISETDAAGYFSEILSQYGISEDLTAINI